MRSIHKPLRWLVAVMLAAACLGDASASAFEAHNFIEPPFGSFAHLQGFAIDESNGNVYAVNTGGFHVEGREVEVFGAEGGAPAGGGPSSFTGAGSPAKEFGGEYAYWGGVAVDNACSYHERLTGKSLTASECEALDPSNGAIYIHDSRHDVVDKYRLNGSGAYEYVCQFGEYGSSGNMCVAASGEGSRDLNEEGVAVDAAGDLYVTVGGGRIVEYNGAGEWLQTFVVAAHYGVDGVAVAPSGTIYAQVFNENLGAGEVEELKRNSLTGAVEGEPAIVPHTAGAGGLAYDQANGQLFVDLRSSGEALGAAHEVVSRFGGGVTAHSETIAVDEATGDVYMGNGTGQNIERFAPGVPAMLPGVDAPPPSLSDVTRTSALLSAMVDTGDATTSWKVEYASAGEYRPGAVNPYAGGGSSASSKLAPAVGGTSVGPLPLAGLLADTTYHYRLLATNELGTTYGPDHTFTTAAATPPVVTTGAASEVTQTGVLLSGTVGTRELQTSYGFEIGLDTGYGGAKLFGNAGSGGTEAVSASLQFLIPGTTYHYRLVASNEDGMGYGQDMTFTTPGVPGSIVQPPVLAMVPSPTGAFPSVAGAVTKPVGSAKQSHRRAKRRGRARRTHRGGRVGGRRGGKKG
jgi:hypothetical protein